jgi:hypothetical protein
MLSYDMRQFLVALSLMLAVVFFNVSAVREVTVAHDVTAVMSHADDPCGSCADDPSGNCPHHGFADTKCMCPACSSIYGPASTASEVLPLREVARSVLDAFSNFLREGITVRPDTGPPELSA